MKKIIPITFVLFLFSAIGSSQEIFKEGAISDTAPVYNEFSTALSYNVDLTMLHQRLNADTGKEISISFPINGKQKELFLEPNGLITDSYQLYTSSGNQYNHGNQYAFYHGYVKGQNNSKVALGIVGQDINLTIWDEDGNFELFRTKDNGYFGVFERDISSNEEKDDWSCEEVDPPIEEIRNNTFRSVDNSECVTVFIEVDYNMFTRKGNSVANVESWLLFLMNQVSILYIEWDIPLSISGIQVWDVPDPYVSATNTSTALSLFRSAVRNNPNFNGRLAHLISGRSLGGGIAYLNVLCSTFSNVAVSANMKTNNQAYPTYSWNTMVVAHELGHNFGSNHTQACVWNGNNTAIDGCVSPEGSCDRPPLPTNGGTVMSYCHLVGGVGINLGLGFGPQPGSLIRERYHTANCVTGAGNECVTVPPFNNICDRSKEVVVLNYCYSQSYKAENMTPSGDGGAMQCSDDTNEYKDIWYKVTFPMGVDTLHIEVSHQSINGSDIHFQVYEGNCNNLNYLECDSTHHDGVGKITLIGSNFMDETIYIRLIEDNSDQDLTFDMCIYASELPCDDVATRLLDIYNRLGGNNWNNASGWVDGVNNGDCSICNWHGISCNSKGEIEKIKLDNNNLSGELDSNFFLFPELRYLDLSHNNLMDTLIDIDEKALYLGVIKLDHNNLYGEIHSSFTDRNSLKQLYLDYNNLSGVIPEKTFNYKMTAISLSNNGFTGCFPDDMFGACYIDTFSLANNPGLVFGGDTELLCKFALGRDYDNDGYCDGDGDCDDYDAMINPSSSEIICDGKDNNCNGVYDEGSNFGPNVWIGPDTLGMWFDSSNWSMGHPPLLCEHIDIGMNDDNIHLVLQDTSQFFSLESRDLYIGSNSTLVIENGVNFTLIGASKMINHGSLKIYGGLILNNQIDTTITTVTNMGMIMVDAQGYFQLEGVGKYGIHNTPSGEMYMEGFFGTFHHDPPDGRMNGILNEGYIEIGSYFQLFGKFLKEHIHNSGDIIVKNGGVLQVAD